MPTTLTHAKPDLSSHAPLSKRLRGEAFLPGVHYAAQTEAWMLEADEALTKSNERIAELERELEALKNGATWTSLEEALPAERPHPVLLTDGHYIVEAWHIDGVFLNTVDDSIFTDATHWMERPRGPGQTSDQKPRPTTDAVRALHAHKLALARNALERQKLLETDELETTVVDGEEGVSA